MIETFRSGHALRRGLSMAGIATGVGLLFATVAGAAECPADKVGNNPLPGAATAPAGVTDTVLSSIDLSTQAVKLNDRLFRLRRLEVQPGGVVPMHSHGDRPALIYMISGEMTEYSSSCTVPIVHKAGDAAMESIGLTHWWKNTGSGVAVLTSADILQTKKDDDHMM